MNVLLKRVQTVIFALTLLSLFSVLIGCTAETPVVVNQDQDSNTSSPNEKETSQEQTAASEDTTFAIVEKIALGDNVLTVNGFARSQGDNEFDTPQVSWHQKERSTVC